MDSLTSTKINLSQNDTGLISKFNPNPNMRVGIPGKCDIMDRNLCEKSSCDICFNKSFASNDNSKYWSSKNKLSARMVLKGSYTKYLFNCYCGHEFTVKLNSVSSGTWCPYCAKATRKLCTDEKCISCYDKSFASHEKAEYWSDKNQITPRMAPKYSAKKFFFICTCGHEFDIALRNIRTDSWCPYCGKTMRQLCPDDNCSLCYNKSFASHEKSKYWSDKNKISPRMVIMRSGKKFLFDCTCGHEFSATLDNICGNSSWCPFCANLKLCDNENCSSCYNKSFASHEKAIYFSKKNSMSARKANKKSPKYYWFDCICGHSFNACMYNVCHHGNWCSYCGNHRLCTDIKCLSCHEKSFASHNNAKFWSEKNSCTPRDVFRRSGTKYWFICSKRHEFKASPDKVASGRWCPSCKNKTEQKLLEILKNLGYDVSHQVRRNWCIRESTKRHLPFDFMIEKYKMIIELDGAQHFRQVWNWASPEEIFQRDIYKMKCASENGYTTIRVLQEDVHDDKNDWLNKLKNHIYLHDSPICIFISEGDEYVEHKLSTNNSIPSIILL